MNPRRVLEFIVRLFSIIAITILMSLAVTLQAQRNGRLSSGVWGGDHIQLKVSKRRAAVEFDCAHGKTTTPLSVGAGGRFAWTGTYILERPGPARGDDPSAGQKVSYSGAIHGNTMELTVTLVASNEEIGTYSLKRGSLGNVVKCM